MESRSFQLGQLGALGAALEREHREIDRGIEAFQAARQKGAEDPEAVAALQAALRSLRRHIYLEEEFLFPAMEGELAVPIRVMVREHGEIWQAVERLEGELRKRADPAGACKELLARLDRHNAKEEPIFYTRADLLLDAGQIAQLKEFLESGQMPAGWTCEALRR